MGWVRGNGRTRLQKPYFKQYASGMDVFTNLLTMLMATSPTGVDKMGAPIPGAAPLPAGEKGSSFGVSGDRCRRRVYERSATKGRNSIERQREWVLLGALLCAN